VRESRRRWAMTGRPKTATVGKNVGDGARHSSGSGVGGIDG